MGRTRQAPASGILATMLLATSLATACSSGPGTGATHSPAQAVSPSGSPSPSDNASPVPVAGAFGVLFSPDSGQTGYNVSLIGIDGKVAAQAGASLPNPVSCATASVAVVPLPISTSNTRVYFMDHLGIVRFLAPNGDTGRATSVPTGPGRRSMFAVSPDDKQIAVIVRDFSAAGGSMKLYVDDRPTPHTTSSTARPAPPACGRPVGMAAAWCLQRCLPALRPRAARLSAAGRRSSMWSTR